MKRCKSTGTGTRVRAHNVLCRIHRQKSTSKKRVGDVTSIGYYCYFTADGTPLTMAAMKAERGGSLYQQCQRSLRGRKSISTLGISMLKLASIGLLGGQITPRFTSFSNVGWRFAGGGN